MLTNRQFAIHYRLFLIFIAPVLALTQVCASRHGENFFVATPKYEVRAVWLTTLNGLDWPRCKAVDAPSVERQKKELTDILDYLQRANINTVLLQTRVRGSVIYPSAIEPWDECLTGTAGKNPGYDPLAFAVEECHKRGMEIQAWVVAIPIGGWNSAGCKALRSKHPSIVTKLGNHGYINPENPLSADYIAEICKEITRHYDIDGIHLDYIRFPEEWGTAGKAARRRKTPKGRITSEQTSLTSRQANITRIVKAINNEVKSIKPWVKTTCAPIGKHSDLARYSSRGWNAFVKGCQDVRTWLRTGLVDQIYPMMYFQGNQFYPFMLDWSENSYGRTVVPGLGAYLLSPSEGNLPTDEIECQMRLSRSYADGYAFFRERFLRDNTKGLRHFTETEFNLYPALIPPMTWVNTTRPETPGNLRVNADNGIVTVTWSSATDNTGGGLTYNVYSSPTYPVDINDARNLVAMRIRDNRIELNQPAPRHYAVTAIDRYGKESLPLYLKADKAAAPAQMLANDGRRITLPESVTATDAEFIMIKSLAGTIVSTHPIQGRKADITNVPDGSYAIYTLNKKGIAHRLGFTMIKRR